MRRFVVACISLIFISPVMALPFQGSAVFQRLNTDVYTASVYAFSDDASQWLQPGTPLTLRMDILSDHLSPRRFYRLWNEGLAVNLSEAQLNVWAPDITRFISLLPDDLRTGDQVLVSNESGQTRVQVNGVALLMLDDPAFTNLLLNAWIGKFAQSPSLRDGLLHFPVAEKPVQEQHLAGLAWSPGRDAAVQQWRRSAGQEGKPEMAAAVTAVAPVSVPASGPVTVPAAPQPAGLAVAAVPVAAVVAESAATVRQDAVKAVVDVTAPVVTAVTSKPLPPAHPEVSQISETIARQQAAARYVKALLRQANGHADYPQRALQRRMEGSVVVALTLDDAGQLLAVETAQSSGFPLLDQAALTAARRAAPYPQPPSELTADDLEFDVPFRFALAH